MSKEIALAKFELLAAEAKVAAIDYRSGKYWPGELDAVLTRMETLLKEIRNAAPDR